MGDTLSRKIHVYSKFTEFVGQFEYDQQILQRLIGSIPPEINDLYQREKKSTLYSW